MFPEWLGGVSGNVAIKITDAKLLNFFLLHSTDLLILEGDWCS